MGEKERERESRALNDKGGTLGLGFPARCYSSSRLRRGLENSGKVIYGDLL